MCIVFDSTALWKSQVKFLKTKKLAKEIIENVS